MAREVHVFVCYNVLSFEAAVRIIRKLFEQQTEPDCSVLLLFEGDVERLPTSVDRWVLSPPMHVLSRLEKPFRIAAWFARVWDELREKYPGRPIHAYVPHPCELPGNHFLYARRPGDVVDLLPDGLINYFPRTMRPERVSALPRYCVRIALEYLAAWRHGLRYRAVWRGHQTQYERGHYGVSWAFNPEGYLTVSGKLSVLPPAEDAERSAEATRGRRALLFLDQELHQVVEPGLEAKMRGVATEKIRAEKADVVFYKAHPRGKNRAEQLRDLGLVVVDCTGPTSAERVVARERIAIVVGFYSTSLMLLSERDVERRIAIFPRADDAAVRRPALVRDARKPIEASGATIVVAGHSGAN